MRIFGLMIFIFISARCSNTASQLQESSDNETQSENIQKGPHEIAVLELFTSQGCSSCPPADNLLTALSRREDVIALSWHVDYWNRLGWKDPYSSPQFSARQYMYASALASTVYTPQLVINGKYAMVGSDAGKIKALLNKKEVPKESLINIDSAHVHKGKLSIIYQVNTDEKNCQLHLAILENKTSTKILAGENNRATLDNINVVRKFEENIPLRKGMTKYETSFPSGLRSSNGSVVLLLQSNDKTILAGKYLRLNNLHKLHACCRRYF